MPQERHWTPQKGSQRSPNHSQKVPWRPTEALLERCILYLRGFCGPYESTANSNQNVPWSVPNDAQETQKDSQETPATQISLQETPKLTLRDSKWHQRDTSAPQGCPRRVPRDPWRAARCCRSATGHPKRAPKESKKATWRPPKATLK